jgi:predicted NBD/HSP70 family sugar kinase
VNRSESVRQKRQVRSLLHRQRVVHLLRASGPLARADLAERLGVARPMITEIVSELIDDGTVVELESRPEGPCNRGRPRTLLACNPQARRLLGIQIDRYRARIVVADAAGNVFKDGQTPTAHRSAKSVIGSITRIAKQLMADSSEVPVAAVGVCIPGFIDGGIVVESHELGWTDVDLGGQISRALGVPTAVQDTTQAITLAEAIAGEAREARWAVVLDCGGHIGVGLIIDGRPYAGATGIAGAIGQVPVIGSPDSRVGGSVDAHLSMRAMQAAAPQTAGLALQDIDIDAVVQEARRNGHSQSIVRTVIDRIAHTAMFIEALIDPELLILTGLIVEFDELASALETRINEIRPPLRRGRTTTVRSKIIGDSPLSVIVALQELNPDIGRLLRTPTP